MSRKKKNIQQNFSDVYWQSKDYNQRMYYMFFNQAVELALSRFKWINLPTTCNARFLEQTLLWEGVATIATPKHGKAKGHFFSTKAVFQAPWNIYDNPSRWRSFGNNGWNFNVSPRNGVLVYDNMSRYPVIADLAMLARDLADIMRTKQVNRLHQKVPYVITGPQEKKLDMVNIFKQIAGNEAAVLGYDSLLTNMNFDKIDTGVPYLGKELQEELMNVWNQVYMRLGIKNIPFKTERQIEDEVTSLTEPSDLARLSPLSTRREACDILNRRFESMLDSPIDVVWNNDNHSENLQLTHNLGDFLKAGGGDLLGNSMAFTNE